MTDTTCPRCPGPHLPGHPGGPIMFRHTLNCPLLAREDSRRLADHECLTDRPANDVERELLTHLGYAIPDALTTRVTLVAGIVRRDWPTLTPPPGD